MSSNHHDLPPEDVERLLVEQHLVSRELLDDLASAVPQAAPSFRQALEDRLLSHYPTTIIPEGSKKTMPIDTMLGRDMARHVPTEHAPVGPHSRAPRQNQKFYVPLTLVAAMLALALVGIIVVQMNRHPSEPGYLVQAETDTALACIVREDWTTIHVVQEGETLAFIAQQYEIALDEMDEWLAGNCVDDPASLSVGQTLRVPPSGIATRTLRPTFTPIPPIMPIPSIPTCHFSTTREAVDLFSEPHVSSIRLASLPAEQQGVVVEIRQIIGGPVWHRVQVEITNTIVEGWLREHDLILLNPECFSISLIAPDPLLQQAQITATATQQAFDLTATRQPAMIVVTATPVQPMNMTAMAVPQGVLPTFTPPDFLRLTPSLTPEASIRVEIPRDYVWLSVNDTVRVFVHTLLDPALIPSIPEAWQDRVSHADEPMALFTDLIGAVHIVQVTDDVLVVSVPESQADIYRWIADHHVPIILMPLLEADQASFGTIPTPTPVLIRPVLPTVTPLLPPAIAQVEIAEIVGAGDLSAEAVVIRNNGDTIDLGGWTLQDSNGHRYTFGEVRRLFSGASLTINTRAGTDTPVVSYWGLDEAIFSPGEWVYLLDATGNTIASAQAGE